MNVTRKSVSYKDEFPCRWAGNILKINTWDGIAEIGIGIELSNALNTQQDYF